MRKPEEIKLGLECYDIRKCAEQLGCDKCPNNVYTPDEVLANVPILEALAYIQQLERERDAAVEDLKELSICEMCKHYDGDINCEVCAVSGCDWQWRGVQEVE